MTKCQYSVSPSEQMRRLPEDGVGLSGAFGGWLCEPEVDGTIGNELFENGF